MKRWYCSTSRGAQRRVVAERRRRRRWAGAAALLGLLGSSRSSVGEEAPLESRAILADDAEGLHVASVSLRLTSYEQRGRGYQSRAGPPGGPGSERATIFEPQLAVEATQGERLTHRLWIPVDIVTAASPDAIDMTSAASRQNEAGTVDWATRYRATPTLDLAFHGGVHLEEIWRTWQVGATVSQRFAEDNTVLTVGVGSVFDWFDRYNLEGPKNGLSRRGSNTASLAVTQVLSQTTIAEVSYGVTLQNGTLGNNWNIVPLTDGSPGIEILPRSRQRHALVARIAQALPWKSAVKAYYRAYADDWSIAAHTVEAQVHKRMLPGLTLGVGYRLHRQAGAAFFTTRVARASSSLRTADSDLAPLDAHDVSAQASFEVPASVSLHFDLTYERYWRTNQFEANVVTWATVLSF